MRDLLLSLVTVLAIFSIIELIAVQLSMSNEEVEKAMKNTWSNDED